MAQPGFGCLGPLCAAQDQGASRRDIVDDIWVCITCWECELSTTAAIGTDQSCADRIRVKASAGVAGHDVQAQAQAQIACLHDLGEVRTKGRDVVDQTKLGPSNRFSPTEGGCSPNFGMFITCGFAVVHKETGKVTLFDYIHVKWGLPGDLSKVALQNSDETELKLSYGLQVLPHRALVLVIGVMLILTGVVILRVGRRQIG